MQVAERLLTTSTTVDTVAQRVGCSSTNAFRRAFFTSVKDLNAKIRAFIDGWNKRSPPFVWTKTAEEVLAKANRKKTSNADH